MTPDEARKILKAPKFGDADHINAVRVLENEGKEIRLRTLLEGRKTRCWCCDGSGELRCKAGCEHECPTCEGDSQFDEARGLTLTKQILEDLYLGQLLELARELEVAV